MVEKRKRGARVETLCLSPTASFGKQVPCQSSLSCVVGQYFLKLKYSYEFLNLIEFSLSFSPSLSLSYWNVSRVGLVQVLV